MLKIIHVTVNGEAMELAVDERESLTDMLRNRLGLTSVKKGCEAGECGACTVLADGLAINSCIYLATWADGHSIVTVEGLSRDGVLHPLQKAFIQEAAAQCGFCTPGLILTGVSILNRHIPYNKAELRKMVSGHLCRCTGYDNIIDALDRALKVVLKEQEAAGPS